MKPANPVNFPSTPPRVFITPFIKLGNRSDKPQPRFDTVGLRLDKSDLIVFSNEGRSSVNKCYNFFNTMRN